MHTLVIQTNRTLLVRINQPLVPCVPFNWIPFPIVDHPLVIRIVDFGRIATRRSLVVGSPFVIIVGEFNLTSRN